MINWAYRKPASHLHRGNEDARLLADKKEPEDADCYADYLLRGEPFFLEKESDNDQDAGQGDIGCK